MRALATLLAPHPLQRQLQLRASAAASPRRRLPARSSKPPASIAAAAAAGRAATRSSASSSFLSTAARHETRWRPGRRRPRSPVPPPPRCSSALLTSTRRSASWMPLQSSARATSTVRECTSWGGVVLPASALLQLRRNAPCLPTSCHPTGTVTRREGGRPGTRGRPGRQSTSGTGRRLASGPRRARRGWGVGGGAARGTRQGESEDRLN